MPTEPLLSFAALLKRHRRAAGLTQEELAARAGFSAVYISMLERGARQPIRATAALLADALGLAAEERDALAVATVVASRGAPAPHAPAPLAEPRLPTGSFLGALPEGSLVAREAEMALFLATVERVLVSSVAR